MTIIRMGLDTSKHVFQIHGVDENEQPVLRRQIRRSEVTKFFGKLAPTRIGMEACGASHHWARVLRRLGHEVVLPKVQQRFVPIKTIEQQAALTMLGARDLLVKQRTMLINAIRGFAAEFGVTVAKGPQKVTELLQRLAADEGVPALAREMIDQLAGQIEVVNAKLKAVDARMMAWHKQSQTSQLLATIPGVGPIGGVSFALKSLPSRKRGCHSPRCFARVATLPPGSGLPHLSTPPAAGSSSARSAKKATRICGCLCSVPPR
jgi:transposase